VTVLTLEKRLEGAMSRIPWLLKHSDAGSVRAYAREIAREMINGQTEHQSAPATEKDRPSLW